MPLRLTASVSLFLPLGCANLPTPKVEKHAFPKGKVFIEKPPTEEFETLGEVKTKVTFFTLNPDWDENTLCKNYFNKAAHNLLKHAKDNGGDAVIEMRSVTVLFSGEVELHKTPECFDEGDEGQILARGIAIKYKKKHQP